MTSPFRIHAQVASVFHLLRSNAARLFVLGLLAIVGSVAPTQQALAFSGICNLQNQSATPVAVQEFNQVTVSFDILDQSNCASAGGMSYQIVITPGTSNGTLVSPASASGSMAPGARTITVQGASTSGNFTLTINCTFNCSTTNSLSWTVNVENVGLAYSDPVSGSATVATGTPLNLDVYWGSASIPNPGTTIGWSVTSEPSAGATTLAPTSSTTNGSGIASTSFTGAVAGAYQITASAPPGCTFCSPLTRTISITVADPDADTTITIADSPDPVSQTGSISYTITASNEGPDAADSVQWDTTLPANLAFTSLSAPGGWSCTTPAVGANGLVSCTIPTLAASAADVFTLVTGVIGSPSGGSVITTTASISAATGDINLSNQNASTSTTVANVYTLAINGSSTLALGPGEQASVSVDYLVNGNPVLADTNWSSDNSRVSVNNNPVTASGTHANDLFAAGSPEDPGTATVTVSATCPSTEPGCILPPDVTYSVTVEDAIMTITTPSDGAFLAPNVAHTVTATFMGSTRNAADNTNIDFEVVSGPVGGGSFDVPSVNLIGGTASSNFTATIPGTYVLQACDAWDGCLGDFDQITVTVASPTISVSSGDNQTAAVDQAFGAPLEVYLEDPDGATPSDAVDVNWSVVGGTATVVFDSASTTSNGSGIASVGITAGPTSGNVVIRAERGDDSSVFTTFNVTVSDTYVLSANAPTTVNVVQNETAPMSVDYSVNGGATTLNTGWVPNDGNLVMSFATVSGDGSSTTYNNGATSNVPGTYVVTVSGACPGPGTPGCPPSDVSFTVVVEDLLLTPSSPLGGSGTVLVNTPLTLEASYLGDGTSRPAVDGTGINWSITAEPAAGAGSLTQTSTTTTGGVTTTDFTGTMPGTYTIQFCDAPSCSNDINFFTITVDAPSMAVTKSLTANSDPDGSGDVTEGDVLTFEVVATNDGSVTLNNVTVNDPLTTPGTTNCASVIVGASCTLSGTYTVTLTDVQNGQISNTGDATSNEVPGPVSSGPLVTPVNPTFSMSVVKSLFANADGDGSGTVTEGDVLTYDVIATNDGNEDLSNVTVSDPLLPGSQFCPTVAVGSTCKLTDTYTVTATDVANGNVTNTGEASAFEIPGPFSSNTVVTPVVGSPALTIDKALAGNADEDASGTVTEGDTLTYDITVTNSGNVALSNVVVSDGILTPNQNTCASVAVGGTCVLSGTYVVTVADVGNGSIDNTASVTSNEVPGPTTDTHSLPVVGTPQMDIGKSLTGNTDPDGSGTVTEGDVLTFNVFVDNSGNVALGNVAISDPMISPNSATCPTLAVGARCDLIGTYTVTAADVTAGSIDNTGSATSTELPTPITASLSTPVAATPALSIAKTLTNNADGDGSGTVTQGDVLTFRVRATNSGNAAQNNVAVSDGMITPNATTCATLAVGADCDLVGTYTVTGADVVAGSIDNTGSAQSDEVTTPVTASLSTPVASNPALSIAKTLTGNADGDGSGTVTQGDVLTFRVRATNSGNIGLNNVAVGDSMTTPNATTCATLAIGADCDLVGTYTVTATDVANGSIDNTGSAQSDEVTTPVTTTLSTPVIASPALAIAKAMTGNADGDGSGTVTQGDVLTFRVRATNSGNVAQNNVVVGDSMVSPNSTTCATLAIGADCDLVGTYTVTAADVAAGSVTNTGTAQSDEVTTPVTTSLTVFVSGTPALSIAKTLTGNADGDGSGTVTQGDVLTFRVRATNSGNIALNNVDVSDTMTTPNATTCATLAVGADCDLVGSYTVTAADALAGSISNTGSAQSDEVTTPVTASLTTPVIGNPALSIAKTLTGNADGDGSGTVTQGDVLTFRVRATNSGNVDLTNVVVDDSITTPGSTTCPTLAVGADCDLVGNYTVTAADVTAGSIDNTGSAQANEVTTPVTASLSTPVAPTPAMAFTKTFDSFLDNDGSGSVTQGDTLEYTLTATNTGNAPLTGVTIDDPILTPSSLTCASVPVAGTCVLAGTHDVTAADVAAGSVVNTGTADSNETGPLTATATAVVNGSPELTVAKTYDGSTDADGSGTVTLGDTLNYTITATNSGNVALTNVVVTDALVTPTSATCATLAIGADCVLSGTHVVTAGDVATGNVTNVATADSTESAPATSNTVVTAVSASPTLAIIAGDAQSGMAGTDADVPLEVKLVDGNGVAIVGQAITWTVAGPGSVNPTTTNTDAFGHASVTLTFGPGAGAITVTASTTGGAAPVSFTATSQDALLGVASGDGQSGPINTTLPLPLVVQVNAPAAAASKPGGPRAAGLAGVPVTFTVTSGGGSVLPVVVLTDAAGQASTMWTLGPVPGVQTVVASVAGGSSVTFNATAVLNRTLTIVSGDAQSAAPGAALPNPLVVHAQDNGADAPGVTINWSVVTGSAAIVPGGATDAAGLADATVTLGATPGALSIRAERADDPTVFVLFAANTAKLQLIPGLTPEELELAIVIDDACSTLAGQTGLTPPQQDFLARCQELIDASIIDPGAVTDALDALLPGLAAAMAEASFNAAQAQFQNLKARIAALRSGTQGSSFQGLALTAPGGTVSLGSLGQALTQDEGTSSPSGEVGADFQRWGFFASGTIGRGEAEEGNARPAYDYDINGLTVGVDYRFSDSLIFGGALGYTRQDTDLRGRPGEMDMSGWNISGYATWYKDNSWYTDAVVTWGRNSFDLVRTIEYTVPLPGGGASTVSQTARSNSDGNMLEAAFTFGRDFQAGGWSIGPYGRLLYTKLDFDRIVDEMDPGAGSGLGLEIDARTITSLASEVGAKFTYAHSTDWGVVTPHFQLEWEHEFKDDPKALTARFLADPNGTPFSLSGEEVDADYFRMSVGLSIIMTRGRSGFLIYERTVGREGFDQDNLGFGIRIEF